MAVRAVRGAGRPERDEAPEPDVSGAKPRVVRILAQVETELPKSGAAHVRPGAAAALRKDTAQ